MIDLLKGLKINNCETFYETRLIEGVTGTGNEKVNRYPLKMGWLT